MKLTRASALATFAVIHLGEAPTVRVQGREIAKALDTPSDYLLKILQQLVKGGILQSSRGPTGGFELARPADQITLLEIVVAIDGPVDGRVAVSDIPGKHKAKQELELAFSQSAGFAKALLGRTRISDLLDAGEAGRDTNPMEALRKEG